MQSYTHKQIITLLVRSLISYGANIANNSSYFSCTAFADSNSFRRRPIISFNFFFFEQLDNHVQSKDRPTANK